MNGWRKAYWRRITSWLLPGLVASCAPLEDYDAVIAEVPPGNLIEIGGQRVHIEQWGEGGRPAVLLHGLGSSTYGFRELGPRLGRSRRVVALDLNGFGFTERPKEASAYSLDGQVDLVRGTMDHLGIREADVVGHSYGGYLAMRLAAEHPRRVRRLVLVSPALNMDVAPAGFIRSGLLRGAVYPGFRLLVSDEDRFAALLSRAYHRKEVLTREVIAEYQRRLLVEGLGRAYRGFGDSLETLGEQRVRLEDLDQPLLVVGSRQDEVVPLESLRAGLAGAPARTRLAVIEDSGHSVPEEQPQVLTAEIEDFLRR